MSQESSGGNFYNKNKNSKMCATFNLFFHLALSKMHCVNWDLSWPQAKIRKLLPIIPSWANALTEIVS